MKTGMDETFHPRFCFPFFAVSSLHAFAGNRGHENETGYYRSSSGTYIGESHIMSTEEMLKTLSGIDPMPILIAVVVGLLFGTLIVYFRNTVEQEDEDARLINQITDSFEDELVNNKHQKQNPYWVKWCQFWEKRIIGSGIRIPLLTRDNIGVRMVEFFVALSVILLALFGGQVIAAVFITAMVFVALSFIFGLLARKRDKKISNQVPGFLQSMRASVQNNALPQNALMTAIKDAPDELYEELRPLEVELTAGGNLKETLLRFSNETSVNELRFLMSCIVLSTDKGIDLDPQLGVIQKIIESRQRRQRHIQQAVSEIMPTITITSAVLPGIFIFMYVSDPTARGYWFKSIMAWMVFIIAMGIWFGGLAFANKEVRSVEDLG